MSDIKFEVMKKIADVSFRCRDIGSHLNSNSPPSVFVGSGLKYPLVTIGILSPLERDENVWVYDNEKYWAENNFEILDVLDLRNSLLNSRFQSKVSDARLNKKFVDIAKEIAIASHPVDIEIELKSRLMMGREKDKVFTDTGMRAPLKTARVTSNVKVDQKVDKAINDEIKASEGIEFLYKNNFNEYTLSKILSIGVLGMKKNKKFVPTRWSITATDDTIGKFLLNNVRDFKWIENHELLFGEFLGNQYLVMLFPGVWSFELFELYLPYSSWNPSNKIKASTDYEGYHERKEYAFNTAGGYYATRLPILEYLNRIKRQASVVVVRLETQSYWAALGVWVCRESIRKVINKNFLKCNSRKEIIESAKKISVVKYSFDVSDIIRQSKVLKQLNEQKNITEFF